MTLRWALVGDGDSPHLLKWARALAPRVELWAASTRGFADGFDACVPAQRRLALGQVVRPGGGNIGVLRTLPALTRWLKHVRADWVHAHYLSSHGTLCWLAQRALGAPGGLIGSAWGSDILVTPQRSVLMRAVTRRVLRACDLTTSDSVVMAQALRALGAREVMTFPFGLEAMPALPATKDPMLFFTNRALEPLYRPQRVLAVFADVARLWPQARLVVANDGSQRAALDAQARALGLSAQVQFTGRLDAATQNGWYARAQWFFSLPASDSVSVSVLEAMAHGAVPLLSDLPANRELVQHGRNGWIVSEANTDGAALAAALPALRERAAEIGRSNHAWVQQHAYFPDAVAAFLARVATLPRPQQAGGLT